VEKELGPSGGPATREEKMQEALRKAIQLADIANDWNLYEVEIDGEMVSTYTLRDEFKEALK
jgi:hypothetical protein